MLTHLKPQDPKNGKKMGRAQNTVKRGSFWRGGCSAAGGAAPLSYGEERMPHGKDMASGGPLAGIGAVPLAADSPPVHPRPTPCQLKPL